MLTLCAAVDRTKAFKPPHELWEVAARTARTLDGLVFVWYAIQFAYEVNWCPGDPTSAYKAIDVEAPRMCRCIRDLAILEFAEEAGEALTEWGLCSKRGVAGAVADMLRHGAMSMSPGDSMDDFDVPECPDPWPAGTSNGTQ